MIASVCYESSTPNILIFTFLTPQYIKKQQPCFYYTYFLKEVNFIHPVILLGRTDHLVSYPIANLFCFFLIFFSKSGEYWYFTSSIWFFQIFLFVTNSSVLMSSSSETAWLSLPCLEGLHWEKKNVRKAEVKMIHCSTHLNICIKIARM